MFTKYRKHLKKYLLKRIFSERGGGNNYFFGKIYVRNTNVLNVLCINIGFKNEVKIVHRIQLITLYFQYQPCCGAWTKTFYCCFMASMSLLLYHILWFFCDFVELTLRLSFMQGFGSGWFYQDPYPTKTEPT